VIGTFAVDGWAVTFGTARRAAAPPTPLLAVSNVTAHPSTAYQLGVIPCGAIITFAL